MKTSLYLLLCLAIIFLCGCGDSKNKKPQIIFLITLDTTRADFFNYDLSNNKLTPNFAQLANNGMYYENAYALIPITLPSHLSMFHSLPPHRLKIYNNGQIKNIAYPSLVQILRSQGYQTGAVISLGVLMADFGLKKGFDYFIENFRPYLWNKSAEDVNRDFFNLIEKNRSKNVSADNSFFWIHYSDPHEPYFPPCKDGKFYLSFNGNRIFSCQSVDQALVKEDVILKPGLNILTLITEIPSAFKKFDIQTFDYLKFREFQIITGNNSTNSQGFPVTVTTPRDWLEKRGGKNQNLTDYYATTSSSVVEINNKSNKEVSAKLSFLYSMHMEDDTRRAFYKEEIKYMDQQFGLLLDFLKKNKMYENSTFIIMGDHGEGLGEYKNHFGHIHYLSKTYCRVPLIMSGPGIKGSGKKLDPVTNLNIAPTILDLANIEKPRHMIGQSLLKPLDKTGILLETYSPEAYFDAFSIIEYPWQIIFYPGKQKDKLEFINLDTDRFGVINLNTVEGTKKNGRAQSIKSELVNKILKISRIITATKGNLSKTSKRHAEILKSLGYL